MDTQGSGMPTLTWEWDHVEYDLQDLQGGGLGEGRAGDSYRVFYDQIWKWLKFWPQPIG